MHKPSPRLRKGIRDPELVREQYESIWGGTLRSIQHHIKVAQTIKSYCEGDERVIELGSGWGINLLALHTILRDKVSYIALEYTEAGRRAARQVAMFADLNLTVLPFDYHKPELRAFQSERKTLIFTCHSIEQITQLFPVLFDEILAISGLSFVIHIEPVGWQLHFPRSLHEMEVEDRCKANGYNTDLVARLRGLEFEDRIVIERIEENFTAVNPLNPSTLIVWRKA